MGFFKKLFSIFQKKKKVKIIVVGLDNSGKTTLINWLKPKKNANFQEVTPTMSYTIETFSKENINFTILDMSGQEKYRDMWQTYCSDVDGIIFVIDSADKFRFVKVSDELNILLEHPDVKKRGAPILFFANKMDIPGSCSPGEFVELLKLAELPGRSWHITASNALTGEGIEAGSKWLVQKIFPDNI